MVGEIVDKFEGVGLGASSFFLRPSHEPAEDYISRMKDFQIYSDLSLDLYTKGVSAIEGGDFARVHDSYENLGNVEGETQKKYGADSVVFQMVSSRRQDLGFKRDRAFGVTDAIPLEDFVKSTD